MGSASTRITAADFVTPPELAGLQLAIDAAGRIGGLRFDLTPGHAGTQLTQLYQQVPLRVLPPFRHGADQPSLIFLLNPTAGLMDGDAQLVEVTAQPGTAAAIVGQSATRIHPCPDRFCTQQWRLRVEPDALLVVLPGPAIPFHDCRFYQRIEIDLAEGAQLLWGDLWLAGRYARGDNSERFRFHTLLQDLTIRRTGTPVFRDRFCWHGPWRAEEARWHFGDSPAFGSLFATGCIGDEILAVSSLSAAAFPTRAGDTCIRWLGPVEEVIRSLTSVAFRAAGGWSGSKTWFADMDLAPAHWFTPV
jgi:urease accessory protein